MRVIAGEKRGMKLTVPPGKDIRPTTDKVKGAVFNTIQMALHGAQVFVDLFGGSGAMGIEALSRGVEEAWFFDISPKSMAVVEANLKRAGFGHRAHCRVMAADEAIRHLAARGIQCDFVFMDPPYAQGGESVDLITSIIDKKIMKSDGIIMMEHEKSVIMPLAIKNFEKYKEKRYGITLISYYSGE